MQKSGFVCDIGGKGKGNQDSAFLLHFDMIIAPGAPESRQFSYKAILAIDCDGVSASQKGEKGSNFVIRNLSAKIMNYLYLENFDLSEVQGKIQKFINETNEELKTKFKDLKTVPQTTLVGILVIGQWLWTFNLGDSRAFVIKDDQISQISVDHIGTGAAHEITQAFGNPSVQPSIKVFNWAFESNEGLENPVFKSNYYFLICSDGLTDKVSSDEIKNILIKTQNNKSLQDKVEELYDLTMARDIDDNVSIIAVDLAEYFKSLSPIQLIKLSL